VGSQPEIQNLKLTLIIFGLQLPTTNVIGLKEPKQRNGPVVQTNSLATKKMGIVTMILIVRENFNVATTIAYKCGRIPDFIQTQIVALIRRIVIGV
jgi:hypothetical protein